MFYFETSAKTGEGVNSMMYHCISLLPFFDEFKVANHDTLIQELIKINGNNNTAKVYNVNNNGEYLDKNSETSSNIILSKEGDKNKKKCGC